MIEDWNLVNIDNVYTHVKEDLTLRDFLAIDRTILANERTFLAWIRTALSIIVASITFIKFFEIKIVSIMGYCMLPFGFIILAIGIVRFYKINKKLREIKRYDL